MPEATPEEMQALKDLGFEKYAKSWWAFEKRIDMRTRRNGPVIVIEFIPDDAPAQGYIHFDNVCRETRTIYTLQQFMARIDEFFMQFENYEAMMADMNRQYQQAKKLANAEDNGTRH